MFATITNEMRHRRRVKSISTCLLAIPLTFLGGKSFINDNFRPTQTNIWCCKSLTFIRSPGRTLAGMREHFLCAAIAIKFYSKNNMLTRHLCPVVHLQWNYFFFLRSLSLSIIRFILFFMVFFEEIRNWGGAVCRIDKLVVKSILWW